MRREFLAAIGALGLAGLSSENGSRLVLLHTNDIHGHLTAWRGWEGVLKDRQIGGLDRLAAAVLQIRKDNQGRSLLRVFMETSPVGEGADGRAALLAWKTRPSVRQTR